MLLNNFMESEDGGFDLIRDRREGRGLEDDFKGLGPLVGLGTKHSRVATSDDAVPCRKVIDPAATVSWKDTRGDFKCWSKNVHGVRVAKGKAIQSVTGVVCVKREKSVKVVLQNLLFQKLDLQLFGVFPEFAVQIQARATVTGAIHITGRITDRINKEFITLGEFWSFHQFGEKTDGGKGTRHLVPMDSGKEAKPLIRVAALWPEKMKSMKVMGIGEVVAIDKFLAVEMSDFSDPLLKRREHGGKAGAPRKGSAGS